MNTGYSNSIKRKDSLLYNKCIHFMRGSFFRFVVTGVLSVIMEMGILIFLVERIKLNYLIANIIAFTITNIFNYILSRYWVFGKSKKKVHIEAALFLFVTLIGLSINQSVMWAAVNKLHYNYKVSKLIAIIATVGWNFYIKKFIVFTTVPKKKNV